ncbi:DNA primase, partial [Escherichia coli]|nr:DNA primase [Escherichia coli]MDO1557745.1 DNA primase [Escherichia coli]
RDLPIKDLAGYRKGSIRNEDDEFRFYTFPHVFEGEIAQGFNPSHFARALSAAGMLEAGNDRRYKKKALGKIGGKQHVFYVLMFQPEAED